MLRFRKNIHLPAVTTAVVNRKIFMARDGFLKGYLHFDVFTWTEMLLEYDYLLINRVLTVTRIHGSQVAVDARKSLRTIEDFKTFWKKVIHNKKIKKTSSVYFFTKFKPIASASTILYTLLAKKNYALFWKLYFDLPKLWFFVLPFLIVRVRRFEENRILELRKSVPIDLIYP